MREIIVKLDNNRNENPCGLHSYDSFRLKRILDNSGKESISELNILGMTNGSDTAIVALSHDTAELMLIDYSHGGECYDLFSRSDEVMFYDGELGIGNISWLPEEHILVFYKHYIVHNAYSKAVVCFENRDSFFIQEIDICNERMSAHKHCTYTYF